ncbi:abortive infection protein [Spirochaetia bacterium]|nr:abortive infection protein [Spirochaetia bacterium]
MSKEKTNWKLLGILTAIGMVAAFSIMPFTFALVKIPDETNFAVLVIAQALQTTFLIALTSFVGIRLSKKIGFQMVIFEKLSKGEKCFSDVNAILKSSVLWGFIGGVVVVILCIPFWTVSVELVKQEMAVDLWKSILTPIYGGFVEEIIFRLFFLTLLIWVTTKFKKNEDGKPTRIGVWIAIIISSVIFGLGHLGITNAMTAVTSALIIRAVLLNGVVSVIFSILYWKKGLESAMIAHFSADIVLHILIPHGIAKIFL